MAKIIDPDDYVPHNLPIPGIENAKPIDWSTWPKDFVTEEEVEDFNRMIQEMRKEKTRSIEDKCDPR